MTMSMRHSFSGIYRHCSTLLKHKRSSPIDLCNHHRPKQKIVVLMGATGSGKTRLSIDIATRIPSEIINADKIQLYDGLDITTNKIPMLDRRGVPHHLIGEFNPDHGEISAVDYRSIAADRIASIITRRRLPIIAGGSNSFIHALVSERHDPDTDNHIGCNHFGLRYSCCFIWVDVGQPVLDEYLSRRVDDMLDDGMFQELSRYFNSGSWRFSAASERVGLMKAIGVPEFESYFNRYGGSGRPDDDIGKRLAYEEAVLAIKENTYQLAEKQIGKIQRLRSVFRWDLKRMDATSAFRAVLDSDNVRFREAWETDVMNPSMTVVKQFLNRAYC